MENHVVVRTEHMNHHGNLFGGQMLAWVDESAYIAAMADFPQKNLVTRAISNVEFRKQVINGSILKFCCDLIKTGNTSVTYKVQVFAQPPARKESALVFDTMVTFVAIDEYGNKEPILGD